MGWTETTARQRVSREALAIIEARRDGELPWRAEWSDVFDDRDDLMRTLTDRWRRQVETQLDPDLDDLTYQRTRRALEEQNAGWIEIARRAGTGGRVDVA